MDVTYLYVEYLGNYLWYSNKPIHFLKLEILNFIKLFLVEKVNLV